MSERIALLSNVNVTPIARVIEQAGFDVWEPAGYGDILGALINKASGFSEFAPTDAFILVDLTTLVHTCRSLEEVASEIQSWFAGIRGKLAGSCNFYISDGVCRFAPFFDDRASLTSRCIEALWNDELMKLTTHERNVYIFPYAEMAFEIGFNAFFSDQLWYLARIPYTAKGQTAMSCKIVEMVQNIHSAPKKVMVVDLDNTLWGGVVGELGAQGVELSDEHSGLAYKDIQRMLRAMTDAGVILCVASKNNYEDAKEVFDKNTSMVLSETDIAAFKINWNRKDQSIRELADELNLGIDSFVFLDDNPAERALIQEMLPEVYVVDFPADITTLPLLLRDVFERYFKQLHITTEDRGKTRQYLENAERRAYKASSETFDEYLDGLKIEVQPVNPQDHIERITQLINKTNQFNLTTKRYSQQQVERMMQETDYAVYAFNVSDRFGDSGLTAVMILDCREVPVIDTFLMSCRVMGRDIEEAIVDFVESKLLAQGFETLEGVYSPTEKNAPVEKLYANLGYELVGQSDEGVRYKIYLRDRPKRRRHVKGSSE